MKIIDPGYLYEVDDLDGHPFVQIQFMKKRPHSSIPGELSVEVDGTTNEELLKVLIDRSHFLYRLLPDKYTASAGLLLENALGELMKRTEERKRAGTEGKHLA